MLARLAEEAACVASRRVSLVGLGVVHAVQEGHGQAVQRGQACAAQVAHPARGGCRQQCGYGAGCAAAEAPDEVDWQGHLPAPGAVLCQLAVLVRLVLGWPCGHASASLRDSGWRWEEGAAA